MPYDPATQHSPAAKPTESPNAGVAVGPRNIANTAAPISESRKASVMVRPMLADFAFSSVIPDSRIHAAPNNTGEYHKAPRIMLDRPAASTAQTLIGGITFP